MRIQVLGDDTISRQARTYAEYRVFAALTQLTEAEQVQDARVVLRRTQSRGDGGEYVTCTVRVMVTDTKPVRVRTTDAHPYAAINRAVERLTAFGHWQKVDGKGRRNQPVLLDEASG